jgi:branched-subunit amino acid transport protein
MNIWLMIFLAGLVTFAIRLSFIFLLDRITVPQWFYRALRFVPAAVLSAIILPALATRSGTLDVSLRNPQVLAGTLAVLVAWRTKNIMLTIISGMVAFLVLQTLHWPL